MNEVLVSVRMPESLLLKLKELAEKQHYMDVSEEIRSIVRKNWFKSLYPELLEIKRLRQDILDEIKKKSEKEVSYLARQILHTKVLDPASNSCYN